MLVDVMAFCRLLGHNKDYLLVFHDLLLDLYHDVNRVAETS